MKNIMFKYNKNTNKTIIQVFNNATLLDTLELYGEASEYTKERITKELLK